eukprot:13928500-Ditylum_brightwellii.AAC.2
MLDNCTVNFPKATPRPSGMENQDRMIWEGMCGGIHQGIVLFCFSENTKNTHYCQQGYSRLFRMKLKEIWHRDE